MSDGPCAYRIIKRPRGEAPEWVRDAWIGVGLYPCYPPNDGPAYELWSGKECPHTNGFIIEMSDAIEILAEKQPEAAQWWAENLGSPRVESDIFIFDAECGQQRPPPKPPSDLPIQDWQPDP